MPARMITTCLVGVAVIAGAVLGAGMLLGLEDPTRLRPVAGLACIGFVMAVVERASRRA
ncbi:hypothetical protein [Paraconexibacter sp.]|uniref:hypothetical protein n=1 Tax=Paraconexibacter sp. TaxID=2949640 RepID=UPI00356816B5